MTDAPVRMRRALIEEPVDLYHGDAALETVETVWFGRYGYFDDDDDDFDRPIRPPARAALEDDEADEGGKGKDKDGSLARSAASGARVLMLGQIVRFVVQIGGLITMSRLLGPAEVGLVAMVTAITNVAEIIRDFGLSSAAIQAKHVTRDERTNLFWANVGIGTICAVIVAFCAAPMAAMYHEPRVQPIALTLAGVFIMSGANTQLRADMSRRLQFTAMALSDVAAQVAAVTVSISAALLGASYWAIVLQQATVVGASLLFNAIQCRWWPGWYKRGVSIKRFMEYGKNVLGTNLLGYAVNNVDNIGLSYVWGKDVVGLYSRAFNLLAMPMTQINAPLGRVALPVLSRVQEDRAELQRYFAPFQRAVCYVLGLCFGMMAALASPLVVIMLGEKWTSAGPILTVLCIGGVFKVMDSANYQIWLATAKTKELMRFYLWSRPIMMALICAGLPWGATGVAWSGTISAVGHWIMATWYLCGKTDLKARPLYETAATSLLGVVAPASIVAWFVQGMVHTPLLAMLAGGFAGLGAIGVMSVVFRPVRRDLQELIKLSTMRKKG